MIHMNPIMYHNFSKTFHDMQLNGFVFDPSASSDEFGQRLLFIRKQVQPIKTQPCRNTLPSVSLTSMPSVLKPCCHSSPVMSHTPSTTCCQPAVPQQPQAQPKSSSALVVLVGVSVFVPPYPQLKRTYRTRGIH